MNDAVLVYLHRLLSFWSIPLGVSVMVGFNVSSCWTSNNIFCEIMRLKKETSALCRIVRYIKHLHVAFSTLMANVRLNQHTLA